MAAFAPGPRRSALVFWRTKIPPQASNTAAAKPIDAAFRAGSLNDENCFYFECVNVWKQQGELEDP
jgi:hypothetical protein